MKILLYSLATILLFSACSAPAPKPVAIQPTAKPMSFLQDVKPILDKRCVVCHSCYNAPCQSKFSSYEGIDRGASKAAVYNPERLSPQAPTRLFIDANSTREWRKKGFFSLTHNSAGNGFNNAILAHMLKQKSDHPEVVGEYSPEYDDLMCPQNQEELGEYFEDKPKHGMPYGFPALTQEETDILLAWLEQGAQGPTTKEQHLLEDPSNTAKVQIDAWETFLNTDDAKHSMSARYLYEHYFLAHFHFTGNDREFYELVRSSTPSPEPIEVIATRRPYDDPGKKVYYRFRKIHSTIVFKTHMVVEADNDRLERYKKLFIETPWIDVPHVMRYNPKRSANPFLTFAQIPPEVRYRFMLDNSEYIIQTFIRGPVCKGQVALNVIHDQFWVVFRDPKHDLTVQRPTFLQQEAHNLAMPNETGSDWGLIHILSDEYLKRYKAYAKEKAYLYDEAYPDGIGIESIWKGERTKDAPMLTVYRHFDSASVHRGPRGGLPRTAWLIDYPQFERIYYSLVAGYDVFGNVTHQLQVRRYMDFLRMEGELNFITLMPKKDQMKIFKSWYIGDNEVQGWEKMFWNHPSKIEYKTDDPKRELLETLVDSYLLKTADMHFDEVNYFRAGEAPPVTPTVYLVREDFINGFRSITAPGIGFLQHMVSHHANVIYLRIRQKEADDVFVSIVINRWHDNVSSLLDQTQYMNHQKDTIDFHLGSVGSYGNMFMVVDVEELPEFFSLIQNFSGTEEETRKIESLSISRGDDRFWEEYDWFQAYQNNAEPVRSGIIDLNRYYNKPF